MGKNKHRPHIARGTNPAQIKAAQALAEKQAVAQHEKDQELRRDAAEREIRCRAVIDETLSKHRCKLMTQAYMTTNQLQVQLLIIAKRPVGRIATALLPFMARAEAKRVEKCQIAISSVLKENNCHMQAGLIVNDGKTVTDVRIMARPNPVPEPVKEKKAEQNKEAPNEDKPAEV